MQELAPIILINNTMAIKPAISHQKVKKLINKRKKKIVMGRRKMKMHALRYSYLGYINTMKYSYIVLFFLIL